MEGYKTDLSPTKPYTRRIDLPQVKPKKEWPVGIFRACWDRVHLGKIALFFISLFLFVLAITLMKDGALGLAPMVQQLFSIDKPSNCIGFGWLSAYSIMSGSPVAAAALTFFDAGVMDKLGAFSMITGSRLGASFIVLLIGFLYVIRGRDRATSLSMGLLSLTVTATTYAPGLFFGALLLYSGLLDGLQLTYGTLLKSTIELLVYPITRVINSYLPQWAVFAAGLGAALVSFNLFDRCLPQVILDETHEGKFSGLIHRPGIMFLLGAIITLASMSVSLSLSILVPLGNRGLVRRENVIPYIMGANITTFIDTLLAAVLLDNPATFTIVLTAMVSTAAVSIVILISCYKRYQQLMLAAISWITADNRNLAIFMTLIFLVPIVLIAI